MTLHQLQFTAALGLDIFSVAPFVYFFIKIFFFLSCYLTMDKIPKDKQQFPSWLCWLMAIPFAGYVFECILLPFAIPKSLKNCLGNQYKTTALVILAIFYIILTPIFSFLPILLPTAHTPITADPSVKADQLIQMISLEIILFFGYTLVWIAYWVKIHKAKKYL